MSRLASFRGPSTPNSSPVQQVKQQRQNQSKSIPNSPSKQLESTYHRKVRACLQEIRTVTETWEDLVLLDGLKSLKKLVDTRTDLEYVCHLVIEKATLTALRKGISNELARIPNRLPRAYIIAPRLEIMDQCVVELDAVIGKLVSQNSCSRSHLRLTSFPWTGQQKQFRRLNSLIETLESILIEAHKAKGWQWVHEEPLWVTWSLEKFGMSCRPL